MNHDAIFDLQQREDDQSYFNIASNTNVEHINPTWTKVLHPNYFKP